MTRALTSRLTSVLTLNCERGSGVVEVPPAIGQSRRQESMRGVLLARFPYLKGMELARGLAPMSSTARIPEVVEEKQRETAEHCEH